MTNGAMPGPDDDADDWPWPLKIRGNVYDFPEWHTLSETISRGMFLVDKTLSAAKARTIARRMKDGRVATAMLRMAQNEIGRCASMSTQDPIPPRAIALAVLREVKATIEDPVLAGELTKVARILEKQNKRIVSESH